MTDATNRVLRQALDLEPDERAWAAEIDRRSRQAANDPGEDWRVVIDEIRADILQR
ncbi:MAG TPA: hypothetical protein VGQ46_16900 [Thermoanaerobaculia bacterium]|jgi:spermidine synthase|nr:hypothetical protein [Thermoanaerobaculia bacterium]